MKQRHRWNYIGPGEEEGVVRERCWRVGCGMVREQRMRPPERGYSDVNDFRYLSVDGVEVRRWGAQSPVPPCRGE